jgi:hypothetical protein
LRQPVTSQPVAPNKSQLIKALVDENRNGFQPVSLAAIERLGNFVLFN